jgi:phage anti-repressor protein
MTMSVESALVKFGYTQPTSSQMAEFVGFSDEQIDMLKLFWDPAFNGSWIYLDDDTVLTNMTNQGKANGLPRFFKHLISEYDEGEDYRKIKATDQLVQFYLAQKMKEKKKNETRGGKHYYAVSGECFKLLLQTSKTTAGKKLRRYFIQVEKLAHMQHSYMSALSSHLLQQQIETKDEELRQANKKINRCTVFINNIQAAETDSFIYIASRPSLAEQDFNKVGSISSCTYTAVSGRLQSYNTGCTEGDLFAYYYIRKVHDASGLDAYLKKMLAPCKKNRGKEMVLMDFDSLRSIVDHVADNHFDNYEVFNDYIKSRMTTMMDKRTKLLPVVIEEIDGITRLPKKVKYKSPDDPARSLTLIYSDENKEETQVIDVDGLTPEQMKTKLIEALTICVRSMNGKEEFEYESEKDSGNPVVLKWDDILKNLMTLCNITSKSKIKANSWKPTLKEMAANATCIKKIRWRARRG